MSQWNFEFNQWTEAFELFYRWKAKDSAFCLVVSTAPYASGYWIERNAKSNEFTRVYRSTRAVKALQERVKAEVEKRPRSHSTGLIT